MEWPAHLPLEGGGGVSSTVHKKIMFPDIVQIQCVKQLYRDLISINIYFAFFSFLFKYNM